MAAPKMSQAARDLFREGVAPADYVERLLASGLFDDALMFTAHVLPARDLVWWGCVCAWQQARPEPPEPERSAFQACVRWIQKPDEENRRAAQLASDSAGLDTPAGCLALAAFCAKGNMSGPELPPVEAPPELAPNTVVAALRLAAVLDEPTHLDQCVHRYVLLAREALRRLSTTGPRKPAPMPEGSIASRWMDSETSMLAAAPPPATPAGVRSAPPPAPPPPTTKTPTPPPKQPQPVTKTPPHEEPRQPPPKRPSKDRKGGGDDVWEGLSKFE